MTARPQPQPCPACGTDPAELARVRQQWSGEMTRADRAEHERDEARALCERRQACIEQTSDSFDHAVSRTLYWFIKAKDAEAIAKQALAAGLDECEALRTRQQHSDAQWSDDYNRRVLECERLRIERDEARGACDANRRWYQVECDRRIELEDILEQALAAGLRECERLRARQEHSDAAWSDDYNRRVLECERLRAECDEARREREQLRAEVDRLMAALGRTLRST